MGDVMFVESFIEHNELDCETYIRIGDSSFPLDLVEGLVISELSLEH